MMVGPLEKLEAELLVKLHILLYVLYDDLDMVDLRDHNASPPLNCTPDTVLGILFNVPEGLLICQVYNI